ncbi:hypothetical protein GCM10009039_24360 [Halocalculus aciditolerans]|uniref:Uncharacterized protein n=2 Tax=Halocalculus aciditolerans TaxID=1383812 RepID=A0A830FLX1_9EURY|nr:hypothetical protein GCM10009039_24360 [Halocalculus aciditolerans]
MIRLSHLYLLIFILVPGYVCLRGYLEGNLILDDQGRTDKLIVIIIGGFASLCITVILHRVNIVGWSEFVLAWLTTAPAAFDPPPVPSNGPVTVNPENGRSVLNTAGVLIVESVIGGGLGFIYGRLKLPPDDRENLAMSRRELRQPWEEAFEYATLDTEATVITTNGDEIHGKIEQLGSPSEDYDILLADPEKVVRAPSGRILRRDGIGLHSYHHYRDISRVEFESGFDYPQDDEALLERIWSRLEQEARWSGEKTGLKRVWDWIVARVNAGGEEGEETGKVTSLSLEGESERERGERDEGSQ